MRTNFDRPENFKPASTLKSEAWAPPTGTAGVSADVRARPDQRKGAVGREELAAAAYRQTSVSRLEARNIVDQVLSEIIEALATDGAVLLSGFGRFDASLKAERVGRNPKTGQNYPVSARVSVRFKPCDSLKKQVARASGAPTGRPSSGGR